MLILDEAGDPSADVLRDAMDPIWYDLSDGERRVLDERTVGRIESLEGIRVPSGCGIFGPVAAPRPHRRFPEGPIRGWVHAA